MSALDNLLEKVRQAVTEHGDANRYDHSSLLDQITNIFGNHAAGQGRDRSVLPASRDPYGDPADQSNVKPASEDPYGDPAAQKSKLNVTDRHGSVTGWARGPVTNVSPSDVHLRNVARRRVRRGRRADATPASPSAS